MLFQKMIGLRLNIIFEYVGRCYLVEESKESYATNSSPTFLIQFEKYGKVLDSNLIKAIESVNKVKANEEAIVEES